MELDSVAAEYGLTLEAYQMGRLKNFSSEWRPGFSENARDLLWRVAMLLQYLKFEPPVRISSGWRPAQINSSAHGAKRSLHMMAKAVDLADTFGAIKRAIVAHPEYLETCGLWMEAPASTPSWVHLDTGVRRERKIRIFKP